VRIHPKDGALQNLLAAEAKKAQALGQTPFLEFDATWCPPCQAITASLADKNELMLKAYEGIYLIHADVDEWGWDHPEAGFTTDAIPVFFKLDQNGKSTGASIDGGAWGEDIPKNIAPVLAKFFHP
jgi:thiol-disulfide isomerase/thioredoxin